MLNAINRSIESVVRSCGHFDALDVDIRFDTPTEAWVNSLVRPTINLFLFDLIENTEKRETSPEMRIAGTRAERRMPPRRIDLTYMVSALTADVEDEHELLWRVLATLLRHREFPEPLVAEPLRGIEPGLTSRVAAREEGRQMLEIWSALGTKPHPAIGYIVTAPMDLALTIQSPLVLTRTVRYRRDASLGAPPDVETQIGGVVRDRQGNRLRGVTVTPEGSAHASTTDAEGRYQLRGVRPGRLVVQIARNGTLDTTAKFIVPGESYDIVLDTAGTMAAGDGLQRV